MLAISLTPWFLLSESCLSSLSSLYIMATVIVPMGFLKVVLLMLMSSSCTVASVAPWAPGDISAHGPRDGADRRPPASPSLSMDNAGDHPGIRFSMTRRTSSCAESSMLQGTTPRSRRFACALERSARRLTKAHEQHHRGEGTHSPRNVADWKLPEFVGAGDFVVSIYLGTPPVKASIIIDTGSDLTWIQSQPCSECYEQEDPVFDPFKSSSYKALACSSPSCDALRQDKQCTNGDPCRYAYHYADGSETDGYLSTETMTVDLTTGGKSKIPLFQFGASDATMGSFTAAEDGVFGLGQGPVSLPSQLGKQFGNKFSYCLVRWQSNETSSLYFGAAAVPKSKVRYTPILPNVKLPTFWYVHVTGISVGAKRLPIDTSTFEIDPSSGQGGTIVDTGTTLTYLLPEAFAQIVAAYKAQVKYPVTNASQTQLPLCFDTAGAKSPSFPTMAIHLDGVTLDLATENAFVSLEENITCLAVMPNDNPFFKISVIGNIAQQNYDVVYDLASMKMGFSPTDCGSMKK